MLGSATEINAACSPSFSSPDKHIFYLKPPLNASDGNSLNLSVTKILLGQSTKSVFFHSFSFCLLLSFYQDNIFFSEANSG